MLIGTSATADFIYNGYSISLWDGDKMISQLTGGRNILDGFIQVVTIKDELIKAIKFETVFNRNDQLNFRLNIE